MKREEPHCKAVRLFLWWSTEGSSGSRVVDGLQRRTNACLKISLHSVTIVLSILPKRIHH